MLKKAFTLIELLVVIGIMAVIAAGVIATINPQQKLFQARDAQTQNAIGQVATALQSYAAQDANGLYPTAAAMNIGNAGSVLITSGELTAFPALATAATWNYGVNGGQTAVSVYVNLQATKNLVGGVASYWCWRSAAGQAIAVTQAAGCTP